MKDQNKNDIQKNTKDANTIGNRPEKGKATKPIKNPNQVADSKDENIDKDFPGYPHYPASEDIMNPKNNTGRVTAELDEKSKRDLNKMQLDDPASKTNPYTEEEKEDLGIVQGTDADVTKEDLENLGAKDRDMDMGEDERIHPSIGSGGAFENTEELTKKDLEDDKAGLDYNLERTGDDLDMPYSDDETTSEALGQGDEENDYYSLGGDSKEQNEETQ